MVGSVLFASSVLATGWWLVHWKPEHKRPAPAMTREARAMTARELCGLVDIDYTEDLVLVSPRGVDLPYSPDWELEDMLQYLVDVDSL